MSERVIIKLGGSLLSPSSESRQGLQNGEIPFNFEYVDKLLDVIKESNQKFVIVIGGGFLNRWYLPKIRQHFTNGEPQELTNDLHHVGIAAGIINCSIFHAMAVQKLGASEIYQDVLKYTDYDNLAQHKNEIFDKKVIIGAGRKPGHSHDVDVLFFAALFGTNQILSFKNIDGIYTADPNLVPDAEKRKVLTWSEYRAIIKADVQFPGASYPIDPIAATLAQQLHMGFTVLDGRDFSAIKEAIGTRLCSKGSTVLPN